MKRAFGYSLASIFLVALTSCASTGAGSDENPVMASAGAVANEHDHGHASQDEPRPFDASRNAMMDVDAALSSAAISGKRVVLVLGGNWCHDSRGFAGKLARPELAALIEAHYELVWVDVGYRDRNLNVAERFGVTELFGTPTILILSPEGELLNLDSVHDWRRADSEPYDKVLDYFRSFRDETG